MFNICLVLVGIILLGHITYVSLKLNKNTHAMSSARQEYQNYNRARSRLRDGSDILTESVRRYVVTGDTRFRDEYFFEALTEQNREWGLNLMEKLPDEGGVTDRIKQNIQKAMKYSNELMELEFRAMRLAATDEEASDPNYREELKNAKVTPEELGKDLHERRHMAMNLLFSDEYTQYKKSIYGALDDGLMSAAKLADVRRERVTRRQRNLWITQVISVALFVVIFLALLIWAERMFSRRMSFLRGLLDNLPLLVFLKNIKTKRYVNYNQTFSDYLRQFGLDDTKGKTDREVNPETAQQLEKNDEDALNRDKPSVHYETITGPSGVTRYFRTTRLGIRDFEGNRSLLGMALDMTEDHEQQLNNEAIEEALMLLQMEPLLASPVKILELVRRRLDADYCYLARVNEEEGTISIDPEAFIIRGGRTLPKRIYSSKQLVADLIDRVRMLGFCNFSREECVRIRKLFKIDQQAQETPRAALHCALRLTVQGEFWGILSVAYTSSRTTSEMEKSFLQKNARIFETSIERSIVYEALTKAKNEAIYEGNISSNVLNLMPIPCVVKDPSNEFRYIRCNRAFATLHHLEPSEMIGRRDEDFYSDESLEVIKRTDAEAMAKREIVHFEDTCLWGDCNRRVFLYWKLPMTMKNGHTLLFCVAQDVTEIRQKINTEHFRNEITAFLLGHSEPEELLDFVAKRLIETLGCQHVLLHRHDGTRQDWFPDDEHTYCNRCVDCPLKTADPSLFCHNGNVVLNDSNISDFPLPENCPTRILIARQIFFEGDEWGKIGTLFTGDAFESMGFCEELLEQVANVVSVCIERKARNMVIKRQNEEVIRINRQLQLARNRAVAAENAKSYFFSCISHDIRTPLNAIIGYTELLKKGDADEKERTGAYDAITMSGRSLLQLINDMIDLARLESDKLVITPVLSDLNVLAENILRSFEIAVAGKPVRLRSEWDDSIPYVEIDQKRMWQILFNLMDNAVKFTEEGEIVLKISFERDHDANTGLLRLKVSDTGTGMNIEEQKRILQPFSAQAETGDHGAGTGLGVTICRHIIERMNGTIEMRSEPWKGTVFDISIPGIKFSERTHTFPRPGSLIDFHGKAREKLRVLIVDDVPLNISVLRAMLRKNGVTDIVCAVNGKDALGKIRADVAGFDLILTDLWMPEMDGRKMLRELRSDPRFLQLNVIAITADVDAKDECMQIGFSDVIFKPVTLSKIIDFLPPASDGQHD